MIKDWEPSSVSRLLFNFDGSSKGNPTPAGFGCEVRDCNGNVV